MKFSSRIRPVEEEVTAGRVVYWDGEIKSCGQLNSVTSGRKTVELCCKNGSSTDTLKYALLLGSKFVSVDRSESEVSTFPQSVSTGGTCHVCSAGNIDEK